MSAAMLPVRKPWHPGDLSLRLRAHRLIATMEYRGPPLREVREVAWQCLRFEACGGRVPGKISRSDADERNSPTRAPVFTHVTDRLPGGRKGDP